MVKFRNLLDFSFVYKKQKKKKTEMQNKTPWYRHNTGMELFGGNENNSNTYGNFEPNLSKCWIVIYWFMYYHSILKYTNLENSILKQYIKIHSIPITILIKMSIFYISHWPIKVVTLSSLQWLLIVTEVVTIAKTFRHV